MADIVGAPPTYLGTGDSRDFALQASVVLLESFLWPSELKRNPRQAGNGGQVLSLEIALKQWLIGISGNESNSLILQQRNSIHIARDFLGAHSGHPP